MFVQASEEDESANSWPKQKFLDLVRMASSNELCWLQEARTSLIDRWMESVDKVGMAKQR